jgi:hypothetical protein
MLIKSLEKMEEIVSSNKLLGWDGWTVTESYASDKGRTSKDGVLKNDKWYIQKRYDLTKNGWNIPGRLING